MSTRRPLFSGMRPGSPQFERVYAIGDVHGRLDLFRKLISDIAIDNRLRDPAVTGIVLLGDLIDRGPHSAQMLRSCMKLCASSDRFIVLKGNHEAMMADALRRDLRVLGPWLRYGGRETLHSFGMSDDEINEPEPFDVAAIAREKVGSEILDWLDGLPVSLRCMNYFFVHAGIRPGIPIDRQDEDDLLWIREPFLGCDDGFGDLIVVHGHTVSEGRPHIGEHRIGIDTGAYYTGQLSAVGLERSEGWIFSAVDASLQGTADIEYDAVSDLMEAEQEGMGVPGRP